MSLEESIKTLLKKNNLSDSSINMYVKNLRLLNNGNKIENLSFLVDKDNILDKLKNYADNTKRNYLISIVSVLRQFKDKHKNINDLYNDYYKLMLKQHEHIKSKPVNEMTESQKKNWIDWKDVQDIYKKLEVQVNEIKNQDKLTTKEYVILLQYVVLSLYVLIPPRRSKDYYLMNIVFEYKNDLSKEFNYLDWSNKKFYFNNYKTSKTYEQQIIDVPKSLMDVFDVYIKFHPELKGKVDKNVDTRLLVNNLSKSLSAVKIKDVLNSIFNKNISSSMLRHIFLSFKYGDTYEDMIKDAKMMGHTTGQQAEYIKF